MKDLIIVKQLPIIEENLKKLSEEIKLKVEKAKSLIVSEETVKEVKKVRADLNSEFKELEAQRKIVKEQVLAPYNRFEEIYKKYVTDNFKDADLNLKNKIEEIETEQKKTKSIEVSEYFIEYAKSYELDWLIQNQAYYNMAKINVTLTASMKSLKEQVKTFVDKIVSDLKLIEIQVNKEEILVEYRKDLNVNRAITDVTDRHMILDELKKAQMEKEKNEVQKEESIVDEALKAPKEEHIADGQMSIYDVEEIIELEFKVKCTLAKAKELKKFLEDGGYDYEQ